MDVRVTSLQAHSFGENMFHMTRDRLDRWAADVAVIMDSHESVSDALAHPDATRDPELCLAARLACFTFDGAHLHPARELAVELDRADLVAEIDRLGRLYPPTEQDGPFSDRAGEAFLAFAGRSGIRVLRALQEGSDGEDTSMWVYLGIDSDGIAKTWKEVDPRSFDARRWRQRLPTEHELFHVSGATPGLVRAWGLETRCDVPFLRRDFAYGQSLLDFVRNGCPIGRAEANRIVGELARTHAALHTRGVVTGDLRPQNVRVGTDGSSMLFDLGLGYVIGGDPAADHDAFVTDPRYLAPEMVWQHRMGRHTEVFQLGMLYHQLRYGGMAFAVTPVPEDPNSFEAAVMRFGLPSALLRYEGADPLINGMLDQDPAERPSMDEVADRLLTGAPRVFVTHPPRLEMPLAGARDTVLIPARIGLPHRGHVDLIARAIDLGYLALISLQMAYTISRDDPYPKWVVMKMVARSLIRLGYVPGRDFRFTFTRFFATDNEHELHFAMLPEAERIVAMVTGNPDAHHLLRRPVFDQEMLFGTEGEAYEPRSWGERLRKAVREGDRATFRELAARGVEDVMSFEELREAYARAPVEFVPGCERFVLTHEDGRELARGRFRRYGTPDEHVVARLCALGHAATLIDPFSPHTEVAVGNETGRFHYGDGILQTNGDLAIPIVFHPH
ncbi:hypothetical protein A2501_05120 [Candidatus Uhrbacteria bacterium RIFOXYC12_FULL_57_11]|nr:MAG: hypothetical protein A2501_05120 [Candidatus Uhrbacteria bacterium RIFOXYC12_FULL_57_11]